MADAAFDGGDLRVYIMDLVGTGLDSILAVVIDMEGMDSPFPRCLPLPRQMSKEELSVWRATLPWDLAGPAICTHNLLTYCKDITNSLILDGRLVYTSKT
jgi:hypothetical protein